jgi:hypothetical protein
VNEHELLETELRQLRPARPPETLMARLAAAQPKPADDELQTRPALQAQQTDWARLLWRWLAPAVAVLLVAAVVWRVSLPGKSEPGRPMTAAPALKVDDVQIERELVSSFDAVGRLPSGEPVRFHCREWMDDLVWHDKTTGVVVEQRTPRLEVVPVRFETY